MGFGASQSLRAPGAVDVGSAGRGTGIEAGASQTVSTSQSVTQVFSAVSEMLQSVGGGVENDKTLRMLIALLILLAMLENQNDAMKGASEALRTIGSGSGSRGAYFASYSSSVTTISIEQSYSSVVISDASGGVSDPSLGSGTQLDIVG